MPMLEVPFMVNTFKCHSTLLYKFLNNLISMVDYDCGFTVYCYYLVFTWVSVLKQVVHNSLRPEG